MVFSELLRFWYMLGSFDGWMQGLQDNFWIRLEKMVGRAAIFVD